MAKIKIQNFGPIRESNKVNHGVLEISKILVFIGDQGTGKSTIAKLISTLTWMEKALVRGDISIKEATKANRFKNTYCRYQNLHNYFKDETEIFYLGDAFEIIYLNGALKISETRNGDYSVPKIMYVPAERNFLSAIKGVKQMKNLPEPLITFLDEYNYALDSLSENTVLPIQDITLEYQKLNDYLSIKGKDFKIALSEASSGFQSLVPLFVVSKYLHETVLKGGDLNRNDLSQEQLQRLRKLISKELQNKDLSHFAPKSFLDSVFSKFKIDYFFNIVEEIEQNLYPVSQKKILFRLLQYANYDRNKLLLTTHSPYIINYLTLASQAGELKKKIFNSSDTSLLEKLDKIVPVNSCIDIQDLSIFEIDNRGILTQLENINNIPTDDNYLNTLMNDINFEFSQLFEIENLIDG